MGIAISKVSPSGVNFTHLVQFGRFRTKAILVEIFSVALQPFNAFKVHSASPSPK
jgi:hypothetical protein